MPKPTHSLAQIQRLVASQRLLAFSKAAIDGGQGTLGMTVDEMIAMILSRNDTQCFKTMPGTVHPGAMQDAYHWPTPFGQMAYVKFCLYPGSKVVVSFKER